jgi:putative DNA primase/helicase
MTNRQPTNENGLSTPPTAPNFIRPNFEHMPPELKQLKNWVLWAGIWNGKKWTKRPIQVSGFGAAATNPSHWCSFDDAKQAYERAAEVGYMELRERGGSVQRVAVGGVGFVFDGQPDAHGLVFAGVDFDGVIPEKGDISSFAAERVKRIGSYVEASVSGKGLHVIVKARPLASGIAHNGTELYTTGRFFTMTGRASATARVVAAPEAFAALAAEMRALKASSNTDGGGAAAVVPKNGEPTADATSNAWFGKLPLEKQTEVVRYAAQYIGNNSKLFEQSEHGGNYQDYLRLTLAIARSGAPDAEAIFLEVASTARDADSEEDLRKFYQNCQSAELRADGTTVGTLLHIARQQGADFDQWNGGVHGCGPEVARYEPGNEEECRKQLDRVVAADPRTYTLGEPGGPLVILRVPDKDALPPETRWEGDLPATTLAMTPDIMERAERLEWMQKAGGKGEPRLFRTSPPRAFVGDYLVQMRGRYAARPLRGIVRVPRIDDPGEIHFVSGYDTETGLFHDKSPTFDVPPAPSQDVARRAAADILLFPFSKYNFDDMAAGRALLLAALFTAIERPFLPVAPMFVVRSSMPGTGKGLIVRSLVRLAFNTTPVLVTWGGSSEEFEKRLGALLLQAPAALSIDNANGMLIKGDLLEAILTEGAANIRPLGRSETIRVLNRSLVTLTGNNPTITGDMARRTISIDVVPRSADPERDRYPFNPVELIHTRRPHFLQAAFIAMRAFRLAGMPSQGLPAVGSFGDWSRRVRDLVYWLTDYDVSEGFRRNKAEDPRRQGDAALLAGLYGHFGRKRFKSADVIAVHEKVGNRHGVSWTTEEGALRDALNDVFDKRGVNAKLFGYFARRLNGAHNGGFILEIHHNPTTNANEMTVRQT